jgi:hypothetical protein
MPLFGEEEENEIPATPQAPVEPERELDTIATYQGQTPEDQLQTITEIEGDPWVLEAWYGQFLGEDDYPTRLDFRLDPTLQGYYRIRNYVIKTITPLSLDTDEDVISTLSGSANVYPGNTPNQWDMFVGRTKEGRRGLFTVVELPRRLSYLSYTAYEINYELVAWMDDKHQRELDRKTVKELYFDANNPTCPGKSVATVDEKQSVIEEILRLATIYYDLFFDRKMQTFIQETDLKRYYDDQCTAFLNGILPEQLRPKLPRATRYDTPNVNRHTKTKTIFDILRDGQKTFWNIIDPEFAYADTAHFYSDFVMTSIIMSDISAVYHPSTEGTLKSDTLTPDGYYVFSKNFYDESEDCSKFERMVLDQLAGQTPDFDTLKKNIDVELENKDAELWFHLIPVALWLYVRRL